MRNILLILLTLSMIACEGGSETVTEERENGDRNSGEISGFVNDISPDYYGSYESNCIESSDLEMGGAYKYNFVLDNITPVINIVEYAESNCLTALKTSSHNIIWSVESELIASETFTYLNVEIVDSELTINHVAYDGYTGCGFAADVDTAYILNSACDSNKDGEQRQYRIIEQGSDQYQIDATSGQEATFTINML